MAPPSSSGCVSLRKGDRRLHGEKRVWKKNTSGEIHETLWDIMGCLISVFFQLVLANWMCYNSFHWEYLLHVLSTNNNLTAPRFFRILSMLGNSVFVRPWIFLSRQLGAAPSFLGRMPLTSWTRMICAQSLEVGRVGAWITWTWIVWRKGFASWGFLN